MDNSLVFGSNFVVLNVFGSNFVVLNVIITILGERGLFGDN